MKYRTTSGSGLRSRQGFTYLTVMFLVVMVGLAALAAAEQWKTVVKRDKEAELLFRGAAIRRAIFMYCSVSRAGMMHCPTLLQDLIKDPGSPSGRRYLRKVYTDPITNDEWVLIKSRDGRSIMGVRSKSEEMPLKVGNFPPEFKDFESKTQYSEWVFICPQLKALAMTPLPPGASPLISPQPPPLPPATPQAPATGAASC